MSKEIYLGNTLYVSYSDGLIKLRCPTGVVYMESEVLVGFIEFLKLKKLISDDKIVTQ